MSENSDLHADFIEFFEKKNFETSRRFENNIIYSPQKLKNFLNKIGSPQKSYKCIHIAGTSGKGSVATYLSRALSSEYKTGLFISPHLENLTERISINQKDINDEEFAKIWDILKKEKEIENLSYFDTLTAISMLYFKNSNVDWAVFETGLGGRLDSTNNIDPEFTVITEIALDHENILGDTIEKIANEKAGIIKKNKPVYTMAGDPVALDVLKSNAENMHSVIKCFNNKSSDFLKTNIDFTRWIYEDFFKKKFPDIDLRIKGRLETLSLNPLIIFDSAHNQISIETLISWINSQGIPENKTGWNIYLNTMKERSLMDFLASFKANLKVNANLYLYPLNSSVYYNEKDLSDNLKKKIEILDEDNLKILLKDSSYVHLICGSMRLYKNLKDILNFMPI